MEIPISSDEYLKKIPIPAAVSVREKGEVQNNLNINIAKKIKEAYYATTSFVDAQVGKLLTNSKKRALDKNTIVVFTRSWLSFGRHGHWQKTFEMELEYLNCFWARNKYKSKIWMLRLN